MTNSENKNFGSKETERKFLIREFEEVAASLRPPSSSLRGAKNTYHEWMCLNFTVLMQLLGYCVRFLLHSGGYRPPNPQ